MKYVANFGFAIPLDSRFRGNDDMKYVANFGFAILVWFR
jgi:hypothetical protein